MHFVDLKRSFVSISKDQDADLKIGLVWGRKIAGWLEWPDLLEHRRIVLLAEASSGKTEEFRHQAETLTAQGKAAFFVRVEDLADSFFKIRRPNLWKLVNISSGGDIMEVHSEKTVLKHRFFEMQIVLRLSKRKDAFG